MKNELIHEVWLDPEPDGQMLPGLCLAGPMGNDFRALLKPEAVKAAELRGHSHFDAMTKYWKLQGWGEYEAEYPQDHEPYPDEWAAIQRTFLDGEIEMGSAVSGRSAHSSPNGSFGSSP